jgi:hypothetical protein
MIVESLKNGLPETRLSRPLSWFVQQTTENKFIYNKLIHFYHQQQTIYKKQVIVIILIVKRSAMSDLSSFWAVVVRPNEPTDANFPVQVYLTLTGASIPELPADGSTAPVRLLADVVTFTDFLSASDGLPNKQTLSESVLLATLVPGAIEHQRLNILFSSVNKVTLRVLGAVPVHVGGVLELIDAEGDDEEEEEEEEEVTTSK